MAKTTKRKGATPAQTKAKKSPAKTAPKIAPEPTEAIKSKKKVIAPVAEKIKKLPAAAKAAPKKIVERTIETTLKTVEKAAEKEAQKASKKALKATIKARKALRKMVNAKKAAKTAVQKAEASTLELNQQPMMDVYANQETNETPSVTPITRIKKLPVGAAIAASGIKNATTTAAKRAAKEIKDKFRELIHPSEEKIFYYERRQIIALTLLYAFIAYFVWLLTRCFMCCHLINSLTMVVLMITVMTLSLLALASVVFVLLFPQPVAVINHEGIKIDHNALLSWNDVELAEEKYTSFISRRPIIALHLRTEAKDKYKLTFMQHLCKHNVFTPFSIPLYAMSPEDAEAIKNIIKRRCKYEDNRQ